MRYDDPGSPRPGVVLFVHSGKTGVAAWNRIGAGSTQGYLTHSAGGPSSGERHVHGRNLSMALSNKRFCLDAPFPLTR